MDLELVFNELSVRNPAADVSTARQWMSEFINTILAIKPPPGSKRKLRAKSDFNYLLLAPNYLLVQWRNDPNVDLETRRFLKALQDKNDPPLPDLADPGTEVRYRGEKAIGFDYAFVFNVLALSLRSDSQWDCSRIELEVTPIDDNEELITTKENVVHASCSDHAQEHADWIKNRACKEVRDGLDLWNRRSELFPSLSFCETVSRQMQSLGNPMLRQVVKRLFELEDYCKSWTSGSFNPDNLPSKATPESETRLQKFRQELTFTCPDGEKRIFSLHLRMTPGAWRLHFCVELGPGQIIIGYIGSKIQ